MEEFTGICAQLQALTDALQTAMLAGDVATFAQIVRGRGPLLWQAVTLWEMATPEQQPEMEPKLQDVLAANALVIQAGEDWLHDARKRMLALRRGVATMDRYRAPLALLPGKAPMM